jgi:hypothetical protein
LTLIKKVGFRVPILSILKGTPSVQSSIRENKLTQLETIMLTSRNEGMFTMNLYEKEFINERSSFVHPYKSFGMGADSSKEKDYVSSLIDPNAVQDVIYMASIDDALKTEPTPTLGDDDEQRYVILEDQDMDLKDLLAQYDESKEEKIEKKRPKK